MIKSDFVEGDLVRRIELIKEGEGWFWCVSKENKIKRYSFSNVLECSFRVGEEV